MFQGERSRLAVVAVAISLAMLSLEAPALAGEIEASRVDPVVLLKDGAIKACGVAVPFAGRSTGRYELLVRRDGAEAFLAVRADKGAESHFECRPTLETRSFSTRDLMQGEPVRNDGMTELSVSATDDTIAGLVQEMMIGGGRFVCETNTTEMLALRFAGPLPQQTRAAYLNCSGDLFRPEEER